MIDIVKKSFAQTLPPVALDLLGRSRYRLYERDAYTIAFVIECPSREIAQALSSHKSKIYGILSHVLEKPVEGAILYCSRGENCPRNCERLLGCIVSPAKAFA